jgi:hypothetical protein
VLLEVTSIHGDGTIGDEVCKSLEDERLEIDVEMD